VNYHGHSCKRKGYRRSATSIFQSAAYQQLREVRLCAFC